MLKVKSNSKIITWIAAAAVICLALSAVLALVLSLGVKPAAEAATTGDRVEMLDLMARYPIEHVVGPVDVQDVNDDGAIDRNDMHKDGVHAGQFHYKNTNYEKDALGNKVKDTCAEQDIICKHQKDSDGYKLTNNTYGIAAEKYFDVESYIYTESDGAGGRILYGWKPNIQASVIFGNNVYYRKDLAENGEILGSNGQLTASKSPIGIYVTYALNADHADGCQDFSTTEKYALIVPKDITKVGRGSAAFVADDANGVLTTYRAGSSNIYASESCTSGSNMAKFTDFACFITDRTAKVVRPLRAPYYWQPRERLAGVYFPADSQLKTIEGSTDAAAKAESGNAEDHASNRTQIYDIGKSAFQGIDSLRFAILPDGATTIGAWTFNSCTNLVDVNIPGSVTSIGNNAFNKCSGLTHISLSANLKGKMGTNVFSGCSKIKHVDNGAEYTATQFPTTNSTLFVMGNKPFDNVLDTGTFMFERTSDKLSAISLVGETGEDPNKVFAFPKVEDFVDGGDRRRGVAYDYIDCDGRTVKNSMSAITVTTYDIAEDFAKEVWCQNIVLPKAVKTIGKNAFLNSHVRYLETYATSIGTNAFGDNGTAATDQWIYIHQEKVNNAYTKISYSGAFSDVAKHVVYENYELFEKFGKAAPTGITAVTDGVHYQIPLVAHIDNQDSDSYTFKDSNLHENHYVDSDYIENIVITNGQTRVVYAKKLSGMWFDFVKKRTGEWVKDETLAGKQMNPTLSNMSSTKWYALQGLDLDGAPVTADSLFNKDNVTQIDLWTKNVARPKNIENGNYDGVYKGQYTFGNTYEFGTGDAKVSYTLGDNADTQSIPFNTVLGLSNDYVAGLTKINGVINGFTFPDGRSHPDYTSLQHAGSYSFEITLNPKWGVWSQDFIDANQDYFTAAATVARKAITGYNAVSDLSFVTEGEDGNDGPALLGTQTPLYQYSDGWYAAQKYEQEPINTQNVTNSYVFYSEGTEVKIKLAGETVSDDGRTATLGDVLVISRNGTSASASFKNFAMFTFTVKFLEDVAGQQSDYYFEFSDYNIANDTEKGITMSGKTQFSFNLTKEWYVVRQSNMFVLADKTTAYSPLTNTNVVYADVISAIMPHLLHGEGAPIQFKILYTGVDGKEVMLTQNKDGDKTVDTLTLNTAADASGVNTLQHYINPDMPAGQYVLTLTAGAVTDGVQTFDGIGGEYKINVAEKQLDEATVKAIHDIIYNGGKANAYPVNSNKKALHAGIADKLTTLNGLLVVPNAQGAENYWTGHTTEYYDTAVSVTYNLDGSGDASYSNASSMLGRLNTAGEYALFYCIAAKNYVTVGGNNTESCRFLTTLYTEMLFGDIYKEILNEDSPYFQDVTYTGSQVQTRVPTNQYYSYSFDDKDASGEANYVNARPNATVTLKLYTPELARWNTELTLKSEDNPNGFTQEQIDKANQYFELSADGASLYVKFNIKPATNSWRVMPQMPSWTFNGFSQDVNFVTAGLMFAGATVTYGLRRKDETEDAITFTVDENGRVVNNNENNYAERLNKLKPGDYYLYSYVDDIHSADNSVVNVSNFTYVTNNNGVPVTTVTVSKAANSWVSTPNVMRWTWGGYNADRNTITAAALYPDLKPSYNDVADTTFSYGETLPAVTFSIKLKNGDSLVSVGLDSFTAGSDVSEKLASLHAGTYVLTTSMGGSDYYTEIKASSMDFVIAQAVNTWTTTPQIKQWTWGQFNANVNTIAAVAQFNGGDGSTNSVDKAIKFTIFHYNAENQYVAVNAALTEFVLTSGAYSADVAAALEALGAGTYYLRAVKEGNSDYSSITGSNDTDILFTVAQANNAWQTTPGMTGWQYKAYSDNFVAGETVYGKDRAITYTVWKGTGTSKAQLFDLEFTDGKLVTDKLVALTVGSYTLTARLDADENGCYAAATYETTFSVTKVNNTWATAPILTGWVYQRFDSTNFTAGIPTLNEKDGVVVKYTLTSNNGQFIFGDAETAQTSYELDFSDITDSDSTVRKGLNNLVKGNYTLTVTFEGTDNYAPLSTPVTFTVSQVANTWTKSPSITGWTYKSFANNFVAGVPVHGDKTQAVYKVVIVNADGTVTEKVAFEYSFDTNGDVVLDDKTVADLNNLTVGKYRLVATLAGTDEYSELEYQAAFEVTKTNNSWATAPVLTGWTYGQFAVSNFTHGVPALTQTGNSVAYVLKRGTGDGAAVITDAIFAVEVVNGEVVLTDATIAYLNTLVKDNYTLVATYPAGDNFNQLQQTITFSVAVANNTWETTPGMTGWQYKGYSDNFVAGVPVFGKTDTVTYTVSGGTTTITLTFDKDGNLIETSRNALNNLAVLPNNGLYTLSATSTAKEGCYTAATYSTTFAVTQAHNSWSTAPVLTGWVYQRFDAGNFKVGVPTLNENSAKLSYTLVEVTVKDGKEVLTAMDVEFTFDDKGALSKATQDALNGLKVGSYRLTVSLKGTDNYLDLSAEINFNVSQVGNTWSKSPSITGWTYGGYVSNFVAGVPTFGSENDVKYVITDSNNATVVEFTSAELASKLNDLKALVAGDYTLTASLKGTTDYSDLPYTASFTVSMANNTWFTTPGMTGWQYQGFNASVNFIAGVPANTGSGLQVTYGLFAKDAVFANNSATPNLVDFNALATDKKFNSISEVAEMLKALDKGNYFIAAYYPAVAGKYNEMFVAISYTVSQATNTVWVNRTQISDWTYSETAQTVTIQAGSATFGDENSILYTLYKKTATNTRSVEGYTPVEGMVNKTLAEIQKYLETAGAGQYSLEANLQKDTNENYVIPAADVSYFTVHKADNSWTTAPSMSSYEWTFSLTAATVINGIVAHKDGNQITVTAVYYPAVQKNGVWTVDYDQASMSEIPTNVGHYALVVTAKGTDNFNELKEELFFNITTFSNSWQTAPENSLVWVWGAHQNMENSVLVSVEAVQKGVVTYKIVNKATNATVENIPQNDVAASEGVAAIEGIVKVLQKLPVGSYVITVTSEGSSNFTAVTSSCDVTVNPATLNWTTPPQDAGWTWGDETRTFTEPAAQAVKSSDKVSYKFVLKTLAADGSVAATAEYNLYSELTDVILNENFAAGNYKIAVTASCANHDDLSKEVNLNVAKCNFTWDTNVQDASWSWGDRATEADKIVEPVVLDKDGNEVSLTYVLTLGTSTETFMVSEKVSDPFAELIARLQKDDVDASRAYSVKVTAERDNYETATQTFTVTVSVSENSWTVEPTTSISKVYEANLTEDDLVIAVAQHGTVVYTYNGNEVKQDELLKYINDLSVGNHEFLITVAELSNKYEGKSATLKVTVLGKESAWDNQKDIKTSYNFVYSALLHEDMAKVVIPSKDLAKQPGEITYSVNYVPFVGDPNNQSFATETELTNHLTAQMSRHAGVYTINVKYQPKDGGYSPLDTTITVTVSRIEVSLDNLQEYIDNNWEYESTFESITVTEPVLKIKGTDTVIKRDITYLITNSANDTFDMYGYETLVARLNALNVGQYTIKFFVKEDVDHTGIATEQEPLTIRLRIISAINAWEEGTTFQDVQMTRGDKFNITVPKALRGETKIKYDGNGVVLTGSETLSDYLNRQTGDMVSAKTHKIEFIVEASAEGNYNGVNGSYNIIISKKDTVWTTQFANTSWAYGSAPETFAQPAATVGKENEAYTGEIKYSILGTQLDGVTVSSNTKVFGDFVTAVKGLNAGTYTITASIDETADFVGATCSATITVSQHQTKWNATKPEVENVYTWVYGEPKKIPAITPDALTVKYTVIFADGRSQELVDDGNTPENEADYNVFLSKQGIGTYIILAEVVRDNDVKRNNYSALTKQITVTISAANNAWKNEPQDISFTFGAAKVNEIIVPEVAQNNGLLTITVDGATVTEKYQERIASLKVGTHTVIVSVDAHGNYNSLTKSITVTVTKQTEEWLQNKDTLAVGIVKNTVQSNSWSWRDKGWVVGSNWNDPTLPVPTYAKFATVTVVKKGETANTINLVINYDGDIAVKAVKIADMEALVSRMKALNVGEYTITVTVEETENYSGKTISQDFTVKQAINDFSGGHPAVTNWNFNGTAKPTATPTFGNPNDVVFWYAESGENDHEVTSYTNPTAEDLKFLEGLAWTTVAPTEARKYYLKGVLAGTENYSEAVGYNTFRIGATTNEWIDSASVIAWSWNGYNREVNLFGGSAKGGVATFSISHMNGGALTVTDFVKRDGSNITEAELNLIKEIKHEIVTQDGKQVKTNYVSQNVASILNWLCPGEYTLTVTIGGDDNYNGLETKVNFKVSKAANAWITAPGIVSYVYKAYNLQPTFTAANAIYGAVTYSITTTKDIDKVLEQGDADAIVAKLADLGAGSYYFNAWVAEGSTYAQVANRQIQFDVLRADNAWTNNAGRDSQISKDWTSIHSDGIGDKYAAYGCTDGTVKYALLNADYTNCVVKQDGKEDKILSGLTYEDLNTYVKLLSIGQYYVRATVAATDNYNGLSALDTALNIVSRTNSFKPGNPTEFKAQWKRGENGSNASVLQDFTFEAEYGTLTITYTLQNVVYQSKLSYDDFKIAVSTLDAGSYNVLVEIAETNDWAGLSTVVMLNVGAGENSWKDGWNIANSLEVAGNAVSSWTWSSAVTWLNAQPVYGNTVYVEIRKDGATSASHYITINYDTPDHGQTAINSVGEALSKLATGNYTITVTAPADVNWAELKNTQAFEITKTENKWTANPGITGASTTEDESGNVVWTWTYGAQSIIPTATAQHGSDAIVITYFDEAGNKLDAMPANAGKYVIKFAVAETDNYQAIAETSLNVEIIKAVNREFSDGPLAAGWSWNGYNRIANRFIAVPVTGGSVSFAVLNGEGNVVSIGKTETEQGTKLENITLVSVDGYLVVEDQWVSLLNQLPVGSYKLKVTVAETANYQGFTNEATTFAVSKASNTWKVVHSVVSYTYGTYSETTFTEAQPQHGEGTVKYVLRGGKLESDQTISAEELPEWLQNLGAGTYFLSASVEAGDNYEAISERSVRFEVRKADNAWTNNAGRDSQISADWATVKNLTDLETLFKPFGVKFDDNNTAKVLYSVLDSKYSVAGVGFDNLEYGELLGKLQKLDVGQYYIRATVAATDNYNGLSAIDTALNITSPTNAFTQLPDTIPATWVQGALNSENKYDNATELGEFTVTAQHGDVKYGYAGKWYTKAELADLVKTFNAGSYNVTVKVDGTNEYAGLSAVVMLVVTPGENSWKNLDENTPWQIEKSLTVSGNATLEWNWSNMVAWIKAEPVYGHTVYVEIRKEGAASASHYITVDYSSGGGVTAITHVGQSLSALDAGTYIITVTAPADVNWAEFKQSAQFTVKPDENRWTTVPYVTVAGETQPITSWTYGERVTLHSAALHGDVKVTYFNGTTPLTAMPTNAGNYVIKFAVDGTDNYQAIAETEIAVTIVQKQETGFSGGLGATGWTWDAFNRFTHRFVAVPDSAGAVTFAVLDTSKRVVSVDGTRLEGIELENNDGRLVVSDKWAKLLNKLTAGEYTLQVNVAATDNYQAFANDTVTFTVSEATNTWTVTPSVAPWSLNNWNKDDHTPVAESKYGNIHIVITADISGEVFYDNNFYNEETGEYEIRNNLSAAPIGWYTMTATVAKAPGMYHNGENKDLTGGMRFQIFVQGSVDERNYWLDGPAISGWTAYLDGRYNLPVATPARGLVYFEFYTVKPIQNDDGSLTVDEKSKITEKTPDAVKVAKESNGRYLQDWYIPTAPGKYYMVARARVTGFEDDNIDTVREFTIDYRKNMFAAEPRMETLLYLGDKANWQDPTVTPFECVDGEIEFTFYKVTEENPGGIKVGSSLPTEEGKYFLKVKVTSKFCEDLESEPVYFDVKLSQNSWTTAPSIKDWSEEFDPNNPFGEALIGSENIVYEYAFADQPNVKFSQKPTAEGSYIMYATLKMEGYADLTAEYNFVIEAAYDTDLLLIDISLGLFACALAIAVTVFAIRRYKEN